MNISVVCFSSSIMRLFTMKGTLSKYQQKKLIIRMATERKTFACPSMHAKCANEPWNSFSKIMEQCAIAIFLKWTWNSISDKLYPLFAPDLFHIRAKFRVYNISRNQWKAIVLFRSRVEAHTYSYGSRLD